MKLKSTKVSISKRLARKRHGVTIRRLGEKYITPEVELSQVVQRLQQYFLTASRSQRGTY